MSLVIINDVEVHLVSRDGLIFANSLEVANVFEKEHAKVIRSIESMSERGLANFGVTSYVDGSNRNQKMYEMNRDGFMFLTMGFNGEKADNFKLDLIDAFNEMEKQLNTPLTFEEMAKQTILLADKRIKELELKILEDKPLVSFAKSIEASVDSVLIANYAKLLSDTENVIIGQNKLFAWLRYAGYLMDGGDRHNVPYQKYIDNGYFEVSTSTFASSSGTHQRFTSKITGKGQIALARKIVEAFK